MSAIIDTLMSIIFDSLPLFHMIIISLIMVKALHFNIHRSHSWKLYQWVHFDVVELRHSSSRKGLSSKKMQNKMTRIIFVLALIDGIFSLLQVLISSNAN